MAGKAQRSAGAREIESGGAQGAHVLIIEAPYYEAISKELLAGATAELEARGASFELITVPGALEIPQALTQAVKAGLIGTDEITARFDGCIVLGCVIRGETSHYDIVCNNANHWLMQVAVANGVPVGNGILTVDTEAQALARAQGGIDGKGGAAARACLRLIELQRAFEHRDGGLELAEPVPDLPQAREDPRLVNTGPIQSPGQAVGDPDGARVDRSGSEPGAARQRIREERRQLGAPRSGWQAARVTGSQDLGARARRRRPVELYDRDRREQRAGEARP